MKKPQDPLKRSYRRTPLTKARPHAPDIYTPLRLYGRFARVVQVWRLHEAENRWLYLERMRPEDYDPSDSLVEIVKHRFGGGRYRARVFGDWDRQLQRERYLKQVSFNIEGPPTAETLHLIRLGREGG